MSHRIVVFGGNTRSLAHHRGPLLRAMVDAGHDVLAVGPDNEEEYLDEVLALGVRYEGVPLRRAGTHPGRDGRALAAMVALLRRERPDRVFCYTIKPVIYGSLAARIAGVRDVRSLVTGLGAGFLTDTPRRRLVHKVVVGLYRAALKHNRAVIFQNGDDADTFLAQGILPDRARITVVDGSGVDMDHYARVQPVPRDPVVFLFQGRLLRDKGLPELAAAGRRLKASHPGTEVRVLGLFDEHNPLGLRPEEVQAWHDAGDLVFLGGARDVRPHVAASSVVVLPSSYGEGIPRSLLEAMAMGRPILTTDVPGCRQAVDPEVNGLRIPPRDADALYAAMARFVDEPGLLDRLGEGAYRSAVDRFDVHKINAAMFEALGL